MRKIIFCLILLPLTTFAGSFTSPSKVHHFQYYDTHNGLLLRQSSMIDPDSCGRNDLYILRNSHPHYQEIVSLILATHMAQRPVYFYLDGCYEGIPSIRHVYSDS